MQTTPCLVKPIQNEMYGVMLCNAIELASAPVLDFLGILPSVSKEICLRSQSVHVHYQVHVLAVLLARSFLNNYKDWLDPLRLGLGGV